MDYLVLDCLQSLVISIEAGGRKCPVTIAANIYTSSAHKVLVCASIIGPRELG